MISWMPPRIPSIQMSSSMSLPGLSFILDTNDKGLIRNLTGFLETPYMRSSSLAIAKNNILLLFKKSSPLERKKKWKGYGKERFFVFSLACQESRLSSSWVPLRYQDLIAPSPGLLTLCYLHFSFLLHFTPNYKLFF